MSETAMPAWSSTIRSRSRNAAPERWATRPPTTVLPEPMNPMSASGFRIDSTPLGQHEDLVAERARVGHMVEHLGALCPGGIDLDPAIAEHAPEDGLLGRGVLDAVDGDGLRGSAEHARLDLDPLVGERVGRGLPADPDHDQPRTGDSDRGQADDGPEVRNAGARPHKEVHDAG